jgi:hypothetical protein
MIALSAAMLMDADQKTSSAASAPRENTAMNGLPESTLDVHGTLVDALKAGKPRNLALHQ